MKSYYCSTLCGISILVLTYTEPLLLTYFYRNLIFFWLLEILFERFCCCFGLVLFHFFQSGIKIIILISYFSEVSTVNSESSEIRTNETLHSPHRSFWMILLSVTSAVCPKTAYFVSKVLQEQVFSVRIFI